MESASPFYDVIRSDDTSGFGDAFCVETNDGTDRQAEDTDPPAPVSYYLVRAENACPAGLGPLGTRSDGTERSGLDCR